MFGPARHARLLQCIELAGGGKRRKRNDSADSRRSAGPGAVTEDGRTHDTHQQPQRFLPKNLPNSPDQRPETPEAPGRFELPNRGFADPRLTTWLRRLRNTTSHERDHYSSGGAGAADLLRGVWRAAAANRKPSPILAQSSPTQRTLWICRRNGWHQVPYSVSDTQCMDSW